MCHIYSPRGGVSQICFLRATLAPRMAFIGFAFCFPIKKATNTVSDLQFCLERLILVHEQAEGIYLQEQVLPLTEARTANGGRGTGTQKRRAEELDVQFFGLEFFRLQLFGKGFFPTAESVGVSAQIGSGAVRGGPEVRFHKGSTRVPPGFHQGSTRAPRGAVGDVT